MTVKVLKMSNGDEIIASVSDTGAYIVSKPRIIFHDGQRGGLAPYFLTNPDVENVRLADAHVVASYDPSKELEKSYLEMTSKIQLLS